MKLAALLCFILCGSGHFALQAGDDQGITLHLEPTEEPPKEKAGQMILAAVSEKPLPVRIAFWTGTSCFLEDANGRELKWTGMGSDGLRVPPPPEAIPSLSESGRAILLMNVHLFPSPEGKKARPTLAITTEWGFSWWLSPIPQEGVYLRATVKGSRKVNPKSFLDAYALKGIGKEGYAQIYEGLLTSNRLWIGQDAKGDLVIQKPGRIFRPMK